jgi:DNA-3-methyladenine glycosylase II
MSEKIHQYLLDVGRKYCKPLESIIKQNGVMHIDVPKDLDIFDCLAQTVVEQQLSYKAANSIWNKIKNSAAEKNIILIEYFRKKNTASIRNNGLSNNKIKAIMGAKQAIESGDITLQKLSIMTYPEFKKTITNLWGFGDWSAEMIAIFYLGKTNIWSQKDLILKRGIDQLCDGSNLTPNKLLQLVDPYQSYLALHIWRYKD